MKMFGMLKRKNHVVCRNEEEMFKKVDALIEQGYKAEGNIGVQFTSNMCFTTYVVDYWK